MLNQFSRTELLFGKEAMEKLANSRVAVFGIGGVGGYTALISAFGLMSRMRSLMTSTLYLPMVLLVAMI